MGAQKRRKKKLALKEQMSFASAGSVASPNLAESGEATWNKSRAHRFKMVERLEQADAQSPEVGGFIELLQDDDVVVRRLAVDALKRRQDIARTLVDRLISVLRNSSDSIKWGVCQVLAEVGPEAIQALETLANLEKKNESVARAIWKITGRIDLVQPVLGKLLEKPSEELCDLICEIGPDASFAVSSLIKALRIEDADLRWAAVDALAAIGEKAEEAIPDVIGMLGDKSGVVASRAAHALKTIGAKALPSLISTLQGPSSRAREFAAEALGEMGESAKDSVPYLRKLLEDSSEDNVDWASIALGKIARARYVMRRLKRIVAETANDHLRQRAAEAIEEITHSNS
jgi:HEAT repeat protein